MQSIMQRKKRFDVLHHERSFHVAVLDVARRWRKLAQQADTPNRIRAGRFRP
jgi:hypothetical protein